jgi:signal peptidase II
MKKNTTIIFLSLLCTGCDQSTKYTAKYFLEGRHTLSYMGDVLRLTYIENSGAFLGLGAGWPEYIRIIIFIVLTSISLTGLLLFIIHRTEWNAFVVAASILIIGGGLGNLIDRFINKGAVIDFMNVGMGTIRTGIFNVADLAIMAGALIFLFYFWKETA